MKQTTVNKDILLWLTRVPASDVNFKTNLNLANIETIKEAIRTVEKQGENKTRLKALRAALNKAVRNNSAKTKGEKDMAGGSKAIDLSGLDSINVSDLMSDKPLKETGKPLLIPLDQIQPDPHQPRKEFDPKKLEELAESIKARGVKSPISVKPEDESGFYIINHGERRWLASQVAGLKEIPAFIDDDHNHIDQAVENIQRENLTPLEIAHFIERCIEAGMKKGEIATTIGKPASFVSDHALFFEFPDYIRDLYDSGRCRSMQALAALHRGYKDFPGIVAGFCSGDREITTAEVREFTAQLKKNGLEATGVRRPAAHSSPGGGIEEEAGAGSEPSGKGPDPVRSGGESTKIPPKEKPQRGIEGVDENLPWLKNPAVQVQHDDRPARLILYRKPSGIGRAWLRYEDDGNEIEVDLIQVELVAIIEA